MILASPLPQSEIYGQIVRAGLARMKEILGAYTAAQITPPRVLYEYNASATVIVIHLSH